MAAPSGFRIKVATWSAATAGANVTVTWRPGTTTAPWYEGRSRNDARFDKSLTCGGERGEERITCTELTPASRPAGAVTFRAWSLDPAATVPGPAPAKVTWSLAGLKFRPRRVRFK